MSSKDPPSFDELLWLEDVEGDRALEWVDARNKETLGAFESKPLYHDLKQTFLEIAQDPSKLVVPQLRGGYAYHFLTTKERPRGIWRRSVASSYLAGTPDWETLLDLEEMSVRDGMTWVLKMTEFLRESNRVFLWLSRGGKDASLVKEFDLGTKTFVEGAFDLPEGKSRLEWIDRDTCFVGTDFGPGSLTASGYPRLVKKWKRGQTLDEAELFFSGTPEDVSVAAWTSFEKTFSLGIRNLDFYRSEYFLFPDHDAGRMVKIPISESADLCAGFRGQLFFFLKKDWKTFPSGSVVVARVSDLLSGSECFDAFFESDGQTFFDGLSATASCLWLRTIHNVVGEIWRVSPIEGTLATSWKREKLPLDAGAVAIVSSDRGSDRILATFRSFLHPTELGTGTDGGAWKKVGSMKAFFDPAGLEVTQLWATSRDGTRIPYFLVARQDLPRDSNNPLYLEAYGGFLSSYLPSYNPILGKGWLERGGAYVLANIRGGAEFGPAWHQAGLKENRQRIYDDFAAVAEDLIARKITSPDRLGITGGSNGGLLVGVALTQRPDLYKSVVCRVPLLDMLRYHRLLAGASWVAEYGDPEDPKMRGFLESYSPFHQVFADRDYPEVFFMTSTKDDRVHPGHARRMAAKMLGQRHRVLYFENREGGHGGAADDAQRARADALMLTYFSETLELV